MSNLGFFGAPTFSIAVLRQDANPSRLWLLPARHVEALVGYLRHHLSNPAPRDPLMVMKPTMGSNTNHLRIVINGVKWDTYKWPKKTGIA